MKVLVVGEGPHDVGMRDEWCDRLKRYVDLEGWLQPLIRRHRLNDDLIIHAERRAGIKLSPREVKRLHPLPKGHGAKALLAKRTAIVGGFDLLVYMVDADSTDKARWKEIVDEVQSGFAALDGPVRCLACVPMSAAESWILTDSDAWKKVTGYAGALPAKPEAIWGLRNDPEGDHPHQVFARVCSVADMPDDRETRHRIACVTDLDILRQRCAVSFPPFADSLLAA